MVGADRLATAMPFSSALSLPSLERLGRQVRVLSAPPRGILLQPGDPVSGAYFVESGSIRVYYLDPNGHEGTLYQIGPGQSCVLALNCLFSEMQYPAWAEAGEAGVVFASLDGCTARDLMASDAMFMKALFEQVSTRLYGLLARLEQAIRLPLEARLIHLLLELADADGVIQCSHERLAGHLGTSREVVSRLVRELTRQQLINSAYGRIEVKDRQNLAIRCG
jgi:CRP/FNR family transcriptional regulator, anaerobic regulatory protein